MFYIFVLGRLSQLQIDLERQKKKEAEETKVMEKAVLQVEDNLVATTVSAPANSHNSFLPGGFTFLLHNTFSDWLLTPSQVLKFKVELIYIYPNISN